MKPQLFSSTNPVTVGVYAVLAGMDVSCAWRFVQSYCEPESYNLNDHIREVNKYWREQLANVRMVDTMSARSNLIDQVELQDWLRLFGQFVAPVVVSLDLPQELPQATGFIPVFGLAPA